MEKANTAIVVLLVLLGLAGMLMDLTGLFPAFYLWYKTAIELYLFGFSAFLVLKRVFFYRLKGNVEVIQLKERSERQNILLGQGGLLVLLYVLYLWFYQDLLSFNSVMIGLLLLYYAGQVLVNSNPSIYVDANAFSFDDYFVDRWKWKSLKKIVVEDQKLFLQGQHKNFELDFELIDGMDYVRLSQEVEASVLDGAFAEEDSSRLLLNVVESYARHYGVSLIMSS